ncbi:hypothetical protein ABEB36_009288 [Hypothenemus hampei]|uniref:Uncharacterized protein n=1 Tax=Hypothenemus hampei TaxID=57062 RepID=A0ABD1EFX0_HYPHA
MVKGQVHTNYKGKQIAPRSTGENCKCKKQCFAKFNQNDKDLCVSIINNFSTKDEQDIYLQTLIEKLKVDRRRPRKNNATERQSVFQFYVLKQTDKVKVCKKAFISPYGITAARVRRLCVLLQAGNCPKDKRGPPKDKRSPQREYDAARNMPKNTRTYSVFS